MDIDTIKALQEKFEARPGTVEVTAEQRRVLDGPCGCPTKWHRYDCPHFKIILRCSLEQSSENDKQATLEVLRMMLQVLSQDEDKEQLSQLRDTLDRLKILPQGDEQDDGEIRKG